MVTHVNSVRSVQFSRIAYSEAEEVVLGTVMLFAKQKEPSEAMLNGLCFKFCLLESGVGETAAQCRQVMYLLQVSQAYEMAQKLDFSTF